MDELDLAIYRYLSPDGLIRFWGSRRLLDPRVSAGEVAEKVGLSEAGVRARLRGLKQQGYLRATEVWVNPSLFSVSIVVAEIPIREPQDAGRLIEELSLVDGVTFARDVLDESDRKLRVYFVAESDAATARRTRLLQRLSPQSKVRGPTPYWIPSSSRALTQLDWRLLDEFRRRPEASLAEIAAEAHLSLKTVRNRFHALLDSRACWWTPSSTSEEIPLSLLTATLREGTATEAVSSRIAELTPSWMPVAPDGLGVAPSAARSSVAGLVRADSPTALENGVRRILSLDGIVNVRRTFALGSRTYTQWFDDRLAERRRPRA